MRSLKISDKITSREEKSTKCYFSELGSIPVLDKYDEVELFERLKAGDTSAKEILIKSNLRFVISVAKQYVNSNITLNDLIQEGNIGLINAIDRYDVTKGFKFISFAVWWIRQSILMYLKEYDTSIKIPLNKHHLKMQIINFTNKYYTENGYEPSDEEVMTHIDVYDYEKFKIIKSALINVLSFDVPLSDDDDNKNTLIDVFINNDNDVMGEYNNNTVINNILGELNDFDKKIIKKTYGIGCNKPLSHYDLLKELGINDTTYIKKYKSIMRRLKNNLNIKKYEYELI
jgi:RNA polymerase primary sigma factor